jgi:hypothetical protein
MVFFVTDQTPRPLTEKNYLSGDASSGMGSQDLEIRNEALDDEILESVMSLWISGSELVPLVQLLKGSAVAVRDLRLELIQMTKLLKNSNLLLWKCWRVLPVTADVKKILNSFFRKPTYIP